MPHKERKCKMDRKSYLSDEVVDRRTRPDKGDAPPEAASGGGSEIPSEMYAMRLESRSTRIKILMKSGDLISEIEPGIP